ncbi:MAG: bifunctional 2-C-methyl-D-erythritol 4-phosphate cytidylyltransferase/2-C-methyl-D-erythritol 2,4-cyclodiphosphate synthase [Rhodospirillaceae bacterium]|jgi:2-C-methyl-D-erythritol 4-phosphate cytidylyltransferase/2-C-methyl-D-erythritol 2,4-cyclodiphosphate synthase|nr:bifunctional 2-C-methyl-D-erythritol 4-phosphate cytidylyltransferase/2-C-methyl-D-erythritol 2,4-cyclodiphosphate synthase [Rhodospirillales bacterium]MBT3905745.1 bifunctional 2-C-methyl-D-erythritol 4-phosphate cytidylyltransferase/2-C-methyl-D-erythritol 2,4-cyclodiphosphate synthase [Rhodospirillaceae bacterium]MBT4699484.1 bifunctional 2-C-methyl-D-erythritol 4-phosphate cytidylyltransferase/2-C-methyl-D-erythritol 2,4-cyclodiphosphate synthase [Rhodospirillaceae bacterium]MBT5033943.1 
MGETIAIIVGAGRGHRFGGDIPKQYRLLGGVPVLRRTVSAFLSHPDIDAVRPVIHPDDETLFHKAVAGLDVLDPVPGGATRQDSVRLGLESVETLAPSKILIHDAARPFVAAHVITGVLDGLKSHPGAIPSLPVTDTLKRGADDLIKETVSRDGLFRAQTPQGFRYGELMAAHRKAAGLALTDDGAVAEHAGLDVAITPGSEDNFKITTQEDLDKAERMVSNGETRTGLGFDVHQFCPGDGVTICGVEIPYDQSLLGHSDADVGLHSITDAILGAIGAGDIGMHFPPSDPQWKGEPSNTFLKHAGDLVVERGGSISNIDVTIICEKPKIGPHRETMRARISEILGVSLERIGVKGTTTERLGFTGRGEGVAAQAIATVKLPTNE